ncbi:hypothetical protein [Sphingobacterium zeae]|uniref:hypothetical protein n=1 Tax=Sphingobacterium zeae TaxID=1776859 RepID=UPI003617D030
MKEYYYVSESIVKHFPDLEKSKAFNSFGGKPRYVVAIDHIDDFAKIKQFIEQDQSGEHSFAWGIIDSKVDLTYDSVDYDENDNEIQIISTLNIEVCKEWGLLQAIEQELGLTKERNIAYVIYKLAKQSNVTPIELINLI